MDSPTSSHSLPMSQPVKAGLRSAIRAIEKLKAINAALIRSEIFPRGSREWQDARREVDAEARELEALEAEARTAEISMAKPPRARRRGRSVAHAVTC